MPNTLVVCEGECNERSVLNPSSDTIDLAIDGLIPAIYHFVVLEADPPIEKCAYVQSLIERDGKAKGQYLVEVRYKFVSGFKHYRKHVSNAGEVKRMFRAFVKGVAPNVAGWDDITGEISGMSDDELRRLILEGNQ